MQLAINTWLRRTLWGLAVLSVIGGVVYAWMPRPARVEVDQVSRGRLVVTVDEDGRTRFDDRYVVSAPLSGTISRIDLDPGDRVEAGRVFATLESGASPLLDPRSEQAARQRVEAARAGVQRAEAAVEAAVSAQELAEREYERQKELYREGVTTRRALEQAEYRAKATKSELASARFGARIARHELEVARTALENVGRPRDQREHLDVSVPVEGVVLEVMRESSGVVGAGEPLIEVGRAESLEIVVDVLTADAVDMTRGARVMIEQWGGDRPLEGRLRRVDPSAFTKISSLGVEEQRVNVIIDIESPRDQWERLGDGFRVEARIVVWASENARKVDSSAVFRSGEGWAVFRVIDGHAVLTPVEIGERTDREVQVLDGLEDGETVVLYPSDAVSDGVAVEVAGGS